MSETVTEQQQHDYARDGYLVVPGLHPRAVGDRVRRLAWHSAQRFLPELAQQSEAEPWNTSAFEDAVSGMYARDQEAFTAFYDLLQNAALLRELVATPGMLGTVAALLGEEVDGLALSGVQLRVDVPNDPQNTHAWHQERAYYPQNLEGQRGLVMAIAVQDTPADQGALRVCPGSHQDGFHPHTGCEGESAEQKNLPQEVVERFEVVAAEYQQGDGLFVNMNTFHQPGRNTGPKVRYTVLCRYHQMLSDPTYIATRVRLEGNPLLLKRAVDRHGPLE